MEYAPNYVVYKDGAVVGYTESTSFVDTTWTPGDAAATYSVAGYVNGACIGDASAATTLEFVADIDGDSDIDIVDALTLLNNIAYGTSSASLLDVLIIFKTVVK